MKKKLVYMFFLFAIIGCNKSPLSKVQQGVEIQVQSLIDSGYIHKPFLMINELGMNDSFNMYRIAEFELPIDDSFELPAKIVRYKDKYLCFFELDEPEMSIKEVERITHYHGDSIPTTNAKYKWWLVVSKNGTKEMMTDIKDDSKTFYEYYKKLWPYNSGYREGEPVEMAFSSHNIESYEHYPFNADSVRRHLFVYAKYIHGEIIVKNNTDSTVCLSSDSKHHFVVVNDQDSLYFSLCDSLPIILSPHEEKELSYESIPNRPFFRKIALEKEPWDYFYNMLRTSAYSLLKRNQNVLKTQVMHLDFIYPKSWVTSNKLEYDYYVLPHGIYDKDTGAQWKGELWWGDME